MTSTSTMNNSFNQRNGAIERPRPKGNDSDTFVRSASLRLGDLNQASLGAFKRQSSLRPSDLPSIQEAKYKDLPTNTSRIFSSNEIFIFLLFVFLVVEEPEPVSTTNELNQLSLIDTTNTNGHMHSNNQYSLSTTTTKPPFIPFVNPTTTMSNNPNFNTLYPNENLSTNFWLTNSTTVVPDPVVVVEQNDSLPSTTQPTSINDAFNSNLNALVQSNNPTNPFSLYGYSMAAQGQLPNINHRQPTIFTPKRGTNPFDDDLIRR